MHEFIECSACGKPLNPDSMFAVIDTRTDEADGCLCRDCWELARKIQDLEAELQKLRDTPKTVEYPRRCFQPLDEKKQKRIMSDLKNGLAVSEISKKHGVAASTVRRYKEKCRETE